MYLHPFLLQGLKIPSITAAMNCPPVINMLLMVTIRPRVFEGAVSAIYTGTVTEAPPVV